MGGERIIAVQVVSANAARVLLAALGRAPVRLTPSCPKARHSGKMNRSLPAGELFDAERVTLASFLEGYEPSINSFYDFGLASNSPPRRASRRKHFARKTFANRTDYV